MKRVLFLSVLIISMIANLESQNLQIKNNLLHDATLTPNLAIEMRLGKNTSFEIYSAYNAFDFNKNSKLKHFLIQPELRWWVCESFNRSFFGVHAHYAKFNVGGINLPFNIYPKISKYRYQGHLSGAGLSYGYQFISSKRFVVEALVGVGFAKISASKYECPSCGDLIEKDLKNWYYGVTRAGISIAYVLF